MSTRLSRTRSVIEAFRQRRHGGRRVLGLLAAAVVIATSAGTGSNQARGAFPGLNGKIAFTSDRDGNSEIYVMNADGSGQANVSQNAAADSTPAWSANGAQIVFRTNRDVRERSAADSHHRHYRPPRAEPSSCARCCALRRAERLVDSGRCFLFFAGTGLASGRSETRARRRHWSSPTSRRRPQTAG
jgi:WD40-like Beta Propeller Repeat